MNTSRDRWRLPDHPPSRRDYLAPIDYLAAKPTTFDYLAAPTTPADREPRTVIRDAAYADAATLLFRGDGAGDGSLLTGRMVPYLEWSEINSLKEGNFLERFAPGSLLTNTLASAAKRIRVLFEHGTDTVLGRQAIAAIEEMRDEPDGAYYKARLLDGLPPLLVAGLRRGLYGSSVRFEPVAQDRVQYPKRSEYNPKGIPEHTVRQARIREFSVVTFPQYAGATAHVRIQREGL